MASVYCIERPSADEQFGRSIRTYLHFVEFSIQTELLEGGSVLGAREKSELDTAGDTMDVDPSHRLDLFILCLNELTSE